MIRVIGVGNPYRRDDAAGLEVARRIEREGIDEVEVLEHDGEPARLLDLWTGAEVAIVVDAVRADEAPGTVHRVEVGPHPVPERPRRDSTHAVGLGEAVELARALDRLPGRLVLYGITGADFGAGEGLTPSVAAAVGALVDEILREPGLRRAG